MEGEKMTFVEFSYTLIRKSHLKYWRIKVRNDGGVIVTVNKTCRKSEIKKFIEGKKDWIFKVLKRNTCI